MSYIKLNIGGKERGLKFNNLAFEEFVKRIPTSDQNKFDWLQSNALSGYACIYAGLVGNAVVKGEVVDFTFEDVCDWVDDLENEDIQKAWTLFSETQKYKQLLDKFGEQIRSMTEETEEKKSEVVMT